MKRAKNSDEHLAQLLGQYRYQGELTERLDALSTQPFTQAVINEIVLWKVNRYSKLSEPALQALNSVTDIQPKSHRNASDALATLLREPGVDLPMASTFLRFRNRRAFQIIDRHAYRAVYGERYPLYPSSSHSRKIDVYVRYLDALFELAAEKSVEFDVLDRILYVFDKRVNGRL